MKIGSAIEEWIPPRLSSGEPTPQHARSGKNQQEHNPGRGLRVVKGNAVECNLKQTELQVRALCIEYPGDIRTITNTGQPVQVMRKEPDVAYISSHVVAGHYGINKVYVQTPGIVLNKYKEIGGYGRQTLSTFKVYA